MDRTASIESSQRKVASVSSVGDAQLLNFHLSFLDDVPVLWTVFAVILLIGAIYYFAVQRAKPFVPVAVPER